MGRRPLTSEERRLRGDPKSHHKEMPPVRLPGLTTSIGPVPLWLTTAAKAIWREVIPTFEATGLACELDRECLGLYCQQIADIERMEKILAREGWILTDSKGRKYPHPATKILKWSHENCRWTEKQFGMNPPARRRLGIAPTPTPTKRNNDLD